MRSVVFYCSKYSAYPAASRTSFPYTSNSNRIQIGLRSDLDLMTNPYQLWYNYVRRKKGKQMNNYYNEFESIHGELVEMMEEAIEDFIYDIDLDGIDILNSNFSLKFSSTQNLTGESVHLQDIEILQNPINIETAVPVSANSARLSDHLNKHTHQVLLRQTKEYLK